MPPFKLLMWMNMPSHHQFPFYRAIRASGIDLIVHYYGGVDNTRISQGWENATELPEGEAFVKPSIDSLSQCVDWRDRIHVVPGYGTVFTRQLATHLSAHGVRWVHWSEPAQPGLRWWLSYPRKLWYSRLVNESALGAFAIGNSAVRDFEAWGINKAKIVLLPYSSESVPPCEEKDPIVGQFVKNGERVFLYVGSLYHGKGIDVLLNAVKRLDPASGSFRVVLVGNDLSGGRYQRMAERLAISEKVLFRGPVQVAKINTVLKGADVLILPSRYDGWGMVLGEAATAGKALIATEACGAAHHLIIHGDNGFRVPAGDAAALAGAMRAYLVDPALPQRHGDRSRAIVEDYSPDRNVERMVLGIGKLESISLRQNNGVPIPCV